MGKQTGSEGGNAAKLAAEAFLRCVQKPTGASWRSRGIRAHQPGSSLDATRWPAWDRRNRAPPRLDRSPPVRILDGRCDLLTATVCAFNKLADAW